MLSVLRWRVMSASTITSALVCVLALGGCEDKKSKAPSTQTATSESAVDEPSSGSKEVVAYPPGYVPPEDAGVAAPAKPKTGVCSFMENSFDGQDTRSNEKLVIKIKDDRIVAAEYRYRGSYAVDGKSESLDVRVKPGEWVEFELPMTSGTKTFKARLKGSDVDLKGTAAADASGNCVWEEVDETDKDDKDKDKKDKKKGK